MKILIVNDILQGGGVEKLMYDLAMSFHNTYEVAILTDYKDADFEKIYPKDVQYFYQFEEKFPEPKNRIQRKLINYRKNKIKQNLKKKIDAIQFDVLLCMKENWIMMMALDYGASIPKRIAWVHTDYKKSYYTKDFYHTAENEVQWMQKYHKVVCVSQVILESIKEVIGDPGNLILRYNPLDKNEIIQKSLEPLEEIKRNERMLFVTVGRLNVQKGYDRLLEVCNLLNAEGYSYDVWIVGGGESWNKYQVLHDLEDQIYRYHLNNVYLLGTQSNPYKYMRAGDWFISSSRYEGYSYVSQEAAILEKPLMLTECAGVMELLQSKDNGVLMENSFKGIYQGMKEAIENPDLVQKLKGRIPVQEESYYKENRIRAIEELFTE